MHLACLLLHTVDRQINTFGLQERRCLIVNAIDTSLLVVRKLNQV